MQNGDGDGDRHVASLASVTSAETALQRVKSDLSERTRELDEYSARQVRLMRRYVSSPKFVSYLAASR